MNALDRLLEFPRFGNSGVNERMEKLCSSLMSKTWWQTASCIKVAGSNGKGTTATIMSLMSQNLDKKVGLYTSPHLLRVNERIQINNSEISNEDLEISLSWALGQASGLEGVGRFEILTTACLFYFAQNNVDIAIMEVGLGGRFDPVRIAPGIISVLTSIDLEHTQILGDNLATITQEKAAICKKGDCLISAVKDITSLLPDGVASIEVIKFDPFSSNHALAQHAIKHHFNLPHLPDAIKPFQIPGRMHCLSTDPLVYVDVAHSPAAVKTVLQNLKGKRLCLICGSRNDKDMQAIADIFDSYLDHVIAFNPEGDMMPTDDILKPFEGVRKDEAFTASQAIELGKAHLQPNGVILCLGGFAIVSHIMALFDGTPTPNIVRI